MVVSVSLSSRINLCRSACIADASYQPRTTWDLPHVLSGVAPSTLENRERREKDYVDVDSGTFFVFFHCNDIH